jgi:hypothetical protein
MHGVPEPAYSNGTGAGGCPDTAIIDSTELVLQPTALRHL